MKPNELQELDQWIDEHVITPLTVFKRLPDDEDMTDPRIEDEIQETVDAVKRAIIDKMLEYILKK